MDKFSNYLFRPHALGKIMGGVPKPLTANQEKKYKELKQRQEGVGKPLTLNQVATLGDLHSKKKTKIHLNDAAKKHLDSLVVEELTGRRNVIKAKYLDKGIQAEERSISLYSRATGKLFLKNKERKKNKYLNGECDNAKKKIRDIKSSWSWETFPMLDTGIKKLDYKWQLDGYMDLWNIKESELIYCLVDTPFKLIEDDLKKLDWKFDITTPEGYVRDERIDLVKELVVNHIFTNEGLKKFCDQSSIVELKWFEDFKEIPEEMRVKVFHHNYCETRNKQMKEMISLARDYMNSRLVDLGGSILQLQSA